jgi:PAS domain S-box-containing protein
MKVPLLPDEDSRIEALRNLQLMDTVPEARFDRITSLAAHLFHAPFAAVTLADSDRLWFKSTFGASIREVPRHSTFCTHTIVSDEILLVPDATKDPRFAQMGSVAGPPGFRFYCGAPLILRDGHRVGALCVIDTKPRFDCGEELQSYLRDLSHIVVDEIELHRAIVDLHELQDSIVAAKSDHEKLIQNLKEAVFQTDAQGNWTFLNRSWTEITEFTVEESLGKFFLGFVHKDDRETTLADFKPLIAGENNSYRHTIRYLTKNGGFRWVDVFVRLTLDDANERIIGTSGTLHDVTYQYIAEQRLKESESRNAAIFNSALDSIIVFGLDGLIEEWNPAAERTFGISRQDALGRPIASVILPPRHGACKLCNTIERPNELSGDMLGTRFETVAQKGSTEFPVEIAITASYTGERVFYTAYLRDLSETQRAQQEQRKLVALVENCADAIGTADLNGVISYMNPAGLKMFGLTADAVGHTKIADTLAPESRATFQASRALIDENGRWEGESQFVNKETGAFIDSYVTAFLVRGPSGEPSCEAAIIRNIVEQKKVAEELRRAKEAAEEAVKAKALFVANMSHEIRTPMNAVIGMTSLLLDTSLTEEQKQFVDIIRTGGDSLLTVINRILDFSKIESGQTEIENRRFNLAECVSSAVDLLAQKAADKKIELEYVIAPSTPAEIIGDSGRVRQVLVNLVANAVKFTSRGEVYISIEADSTGPSSCNLHFSVRDTGAGIPLDRQHRLFKPFSQVDSSTTRHYGGTGLGLAISSRLVELLGGKMWVESTPGIGSTFHFTIRAGLLPAVKREVPSIFHDIRVGLFTSSRTVERVIRSYAEWWSFGISVFDLDELEAYLRKNEFGLIILDAQTRSQAVELVALIRRADTKLPVVILHPLGSLKVGIEQPIGCVSKPIRPSCLFDTISSLLGIVTSTSSLMKLDSAPEVSATERPLRILLAEDNPVNQEMAILMLSKLGYRTDIAGNGIEAVQATYRQPYDVVLMDMQMPELDGVDATRQIRAATGSAVVPWIIAMTANASTSDQQACLASGMNDFLAKPVRPQELKAALRRVGEISMKAAPRSDPWVPPDTDGVRGFSEQQRIKMRALCTAYMDDARKTVTELGALAMVNDVSNLRRKAHYLKGSSLIVGAVEIGRLCKEIEECAAAEKPVLSIVEEMRHCLEITSNGFEEIHGMME